MNTKTISIQNALQKATNEYYKFFGGVMKKGFSNGLGKGDIGRLETELYKFADIKELRPKRKAMKRKRRRLLRKNTT